MFDHVVEVKRVFVNPCIPCEHSHACAHCEHSTEKNVKQESPRKALYHEGKLVIASGEDAHVFL